MNRAPIDFSRLHFVQYALADPQDAGFDDNTCDLACECFSDDGAGDFPFRMDESVTLAEVVEWATEHLEVCGLSVGATP